ncbi:PEP-CTERM sorting domain-containing protein [Desulfobulbus rhabdoformis]|uniref:PEP-CTERM sorting domain-containing protein n=1 Tax=Desulfobulbus rhabdoformis TaxID=34032 RepID=UPI001962898B|nr:PEP-CTERM sorting domain-containing protein [Desulfobulbus rhabdoformis]MBM9612866.1 PEP-CTERM sorting domain-containing protein [Desulfobulbus rhabdoformis]
MRIRILFPTLICTLVLSLATAEASPVYLGADSSLSVDGNSYTLVSEAPDTSGLMWEEKSPGSGEYKICLCSMFAYRAIQAFGQYLGISDLGTTTIDAVTGWSTDGPEHIFTTLGWVVGTGFNYTDPITDSALLTLGDAWISFTIDTTTYKFSSLAENYAFTDDMSHAGYQTGWDFFNYRTHFKTHADMDDIKTYFQEVVRGQVVSNFKNGAAFEVTAVPEPSTGLVLFFGLAVLAGVTRRIS